MRKLSFIALAITTIGASLVAAGPAAAATPTVRVHDEYVVEGVPGQKEIKVPLVLSGRGDVVVQVSWSTSNGAATAGTDYVGASGTTSFSVGQTRRDITLQLVGDNIAETDEKFTVSLTNASGATIADGTAEVLVIDDEGTGGSSEQIRDCTDNNPYTTDSYSSSLGYCAHSVRTGADDDGDRSVAAQVGGPDCNDAKTAVKPGVAEVAGDGVDNNCDGLKDGGTVRNCSDNYPYTNDRYNKTKNVCVHSLVAGANLDADGSVAAQVGGPDCNDGKWAVRPGVAEVSGNGVDDNCDGVIDGGTSTPPPADGVTVIPGSPLYCPVGDTCMQFIVRCAGTPPARAYLAIGAPTAAPSRGVVMLFSGARGQNYWGEGDETVVNDIQAEGFEVGRVAWPDSWGELAQGPTGTDVAACRPSTITEWAHEKRYLPMNVSGPVGECGFCVGGNSAGSTQAAYGLAEYGLETIVDAAVLTSGPALAALAEGCMGNPTYAFDASSRGQVDRSYGSSQACTNNDGSYEATWKADSLIHGANDLNHPTTRLEFIQGGQDFTTTPAGVDLYIADLKAASTPLLTKTIYPNAGHGLKPMLEDPAARAGIIAEFAWTAP